MTEIPEHLLSRSKQAKAKATGQPLEETSSSSAVTPAADSSAPASAGPPALAAAAAAIPADKPAPAEPPKPAFIQAAEKRKKTPMWALPLVILVPLFAISYAGTMQQPEVEDPLLTGAAEVYSATGGCAGCHGAGGGGGVGYALADGSVLETFPEPIDQMVHIARGSGAIAGEEYGGERSGGVRVAGASGGQMPGFEETLSLHELEVVVFHERAILSGEDTSSPEYQEWIEHLSHTDDGTPIDLEFLLACANPEYTPGAPGGEKPEGCPGLHHSEEGDEVAAG
ncbi:MAG: hypothetical protein ACRBI6_03300 [Acidimicrobiales bacterium]